MTRKHCTTTDPFVTLEAQWLAAVASDDRATERVNRCIASIPEREDWTQRPQYSDYGVEAAEHELDAACDRLNTAEHTIVRTPATDSSGLAIKFKVLRRWAGMFDNDPEALDWILEAIGDDFARLANNPAIAA